MFPFLSYAPEQLGQLKDCYVRLLHATEGSTSNLTLILNCMVSIRMQLITLYLSTVTIAVPFPEGIDRGAYIYCLVREHQDREM